MTDFRFQSADGTIDVTFRTDYIGAASAIAGGENVTIHDIVGMTTDPEKLLFANWQKIKHTVAAFKTFATANNLKLTAQTISKPGTADAVLAIEVLGTPGSFLGTVNSATQITLNWTKTPRATGYSIDRATNSGFTAGLVNTVVGDVATLVVTGLTTGTTYYFRIKATAANATDSAYASDNETTS